MCLRAWLLFELQSWRVFGFSVMSDQDILPSSTLSSTYGHFWLPKTNMATAVMPNSRLQNGIPRQRLTSLSGYT